MITENVSTLKIHKLTQAQYDRAFELGNIEENAIYLTPNDCNAMSADNPVGTGSFSLNRNGEVGEYSVAVGDSTVASENCSYAEGFATESVGIASHSEGYLTCAGDSREVRVATTSETAGSYTHAEGYGTVASGACSHAEGDGTLADGFASHSEGRETSALADYSHAEGFKTTAQKYAHSEGYSTTANGNASHAEGGTTTANGFYSHAEGGHTLAEGYYSHAEGEHTTADGKSSHSEGRYTTALECQHAQGHYNNATNAVAGVDSGTSTGTAFVIGNGTENSPSNAFRVSYDGTPYSKSALTTTGCDYAEYFEWQDLNPDIEDRRGYFVTLDGDKIKIAQPNDYILGIISGHPSVIGNGDEDWMGRYIFDEFGDFVYEDFEYETEEFDEKTGESIFVTKIGKKYKENPNYDSSITYIQREDRAEWDAVGMLGVLSVRDDGTCQVNGYCTVAEGGIATASEVGYRVIKRINDNIVKVVFK